MTEVYVGIGSNIDREKNICSGVSELDKYYGPLVLSSVYESHAFGFSGDNFYNLVAGFKTDDKLDQLVRKLREIESKFGRKREVRSFLSRKLDIDLLLYGNLIRHDTFDLPRKDIRDYAFVLCPLVEIAGSAIHPETGDTFDSLWQSFDRSKQPLWIVDLKLPVDQVCHP